ncbi:MAG TPA: hypothetical protein VNW30_10610 [Opitutaceae bacterium]|jgi:hypothetical protein|nr:hypothetical protein [Opitutaceae bacterium]
MDTRSQIEKLNAMANDPAASEGERQNARTILEKRKGRPCIRRFWRPRRIARKSASSSRPIFTTSPIFTTPHVFRSTAAPHTQLAPAVQQPLPLAEVLREFIEIAEPFVMIGLGVAAAAAVIEEIRPKPRFR